MLTKTIDKWMACFTAGGVLTMFTVIFGKMDYSIILLLIAMATDFITGIMCGIKSHELSSGKCFEGIWMFFYYHLTSSSMILCALVFALCTLLMK